jgi:AraC-like DNA-binding protein
MISASDLLALNAFAASKRVDLARQQALHEIDLQTDATPDGSISCLAFARLVRSLAEETGDDAFGLHFVETLPPRPAGVFHHIIFNSRTLREAFQAIARFLGLVTDAFQIQYHEDNAAGWMVFNCPNDIEPLREFMDGQIALIAIRARQLIGGRSTPTRIDLTRPEPRQRDEFERVFGIMPNFGQSTNHIGFELALLATPLPAANPELFATATEYASQLLRLTKFDSTFSTAVANYIAGALQRGDAGEGKAAAELGVTVRTLQRNLASEGTSYKALTEDTRLRLARHYLLNTDLSLTAIAFLLGYSELSAFSRAARGWLGDTPSTLRKRHRL